MPVTPYPSRRATSMPSAVWSTVASFIEAAEPLVGRRLQAEEDVELARQRPPRLEQLGMAGDEIDAALHEHPPFADAPAPSSCASARLRDGWCQNRSSATKMSIADGGEVAADRVDRPLAHRAGVQLPDRAERAAERAAPRRLDQPDRTMREARVLPAPRGHVPSRRQRHVVQREGRRSRLACGCLRPRRQAARAPAPSSAAACVRAPRTVAASRARRRRPRRRIRRATETDLDTRRPCARQ